MQKTGFTIEINGVEKYLSDFESLNKAYKDNLLLLKKMESGTVEYYEQQKVVAQLKNGINDFNTSLKEQATLLKDVPSGSIKELNKEYKLQLDILKNLEVGSDEYVAQLEVVGKLKNDIKSFNKELRKQAKEFENIEKGVSVYKELEAETRKLKNESKELAAQLLKLEKAGKKNTDEYKALEKQYKKTTKEAQEYDEALKEIDETVGDSFRNVGNYKDAFRDAFDSAGVGLDGFDDKMKLLSKNPILLVLTAVVGILYKLGQAFKSSEKGSKLFSQATAVINSLFSSLVKISVQLFEKVEKVFKDNQGNLEKFGKFIEDEILNRVYGLIDGMTGLGKVIQKVFKGDFKGASEEAKKANESFKNIFTGDENLDGVKGKIKEFTDDLKENGKAALALDNLRRSSAATNRALQKSLQDVLDKEAKLQAIADDQSKGIEAQIQAQKDLLEVQRQKAKIEVDIAKNNASVINSEIALRKRNGEAVSDLLDSQTDAYIAIREAERNLTQVTAENNKERYNLTRDSFERQLDFLIDGVDSYKAVNERILADETVNFAQRQQLLKDTQKEFENSFNEQINLVEEFAGKQINANDLVNESNSKVLAEKVKNLGLDDVVAGRLLEIIRDRRAGLQDLAESERDLAQKKKESDLKQLESETELQEQLNEIKFKKGLISEEEYNKQSIQLSIDRLNKELELEDLKGNERLAKLNEIQLKELELKEANIKVELDNIDKKYDLEEQKLNEQLLRGEIKAKEHEDRLKEIRSEAFDEKLEFIEETGDENLEVVKEILDEEVEAYKEKNGKIIDEEEKLKDQRIQIAKNVTGTLQTLSDGLYSRMIANAEGNEEKQNELRRKQFNLNKVFSATNVIIDTAAAVAKVMAQTGTVAPFLIPSIIAQGAAQTAIILSQAPPMAQGGFTGRGGVIDETGERTTGLYRLHEGEYVAPKSQVMSNPSLFAALEQNRRNGSSLMTPIQQTSNDSDIIDAISKLTSNIKVVADSEEIVKLGLEKRNFKKSKNL